MNIFLSKRKCFMVKIGNTFICIGQRRENKIADKTSIGDYSGGMKHCPSLILCS